MERSPPVGMMMMEWNAKTSSLWDWDNPMLFGGNHKQQPAERAICSGSVYSSAAGGDWSASEPGNGSSSKSSIDSSSHAGIGAPSFNIEAFPKYCDRSADSARMQGTGASPAAALTQEPLIGLKLGKRTYFEDGCPGSSSVRKPASSSSASSSPSATPTALVKRLRPSHQSTQTFHCQVEGCNIDLTGAKGYHRKHRVCESHSKCPRVIIAGQERRFCQQCSRFHDLSAFDEKKRSCRKRLSDHNARRRKPQPGIISPNSGSLSSSFYDDGHQINFLLNKAPFGHMRPSPSSTWEGSSDFKFTHAKDSWIKSAKRGDNEAQLLLPSTALSNTIPTLHHDLDRFLPFKGVTAEVLNAGPEASTITSNLNGAPDLRHALSLLSMDAWGSADPSGLTSSLSHPVHPNHTDAAQPAVQATNLASNYWQHEKPQAQQARTLPFAMHSDGSQFQEFQLRKAPYYDTTFFDSSRIH